MIHTLAITKDLSLKKDLPIEKLNETNIKWFWVDFDCPTPQEAELLDTHFHFHKLAIEDCLYDLQRAKLDYYEGYSFFVLHSLNEKTLSPEEVDMFMSEKFIVSFHSTHLAEFDEVWRKIATPESTLNEGTIYICYHILDEIVDHYFPAVYTLENLIDEIGDSLSKDSMDKVFEIRSDLLKLRRIISQMRDLVYRALNSTHLEEVNNKRVYFVDVYDHILRLSEMIESSQAITSEIRDSFVSLNSHKMNTIMMILTVISSIFIPLTFIVGIYGMNFDYMPELHFRYSYFIIMSILLLIGIGMSCWFKRRGWLNLK
ncbi:magnesium/cobalt transporter CorA [Clostridium estertheticum]|nr:magnesium/cobalt transporter CorA [Clostridium estertheticum]MBU3185105.1 magnesium/cobalt transporter CorA [Clostridium estertheticum]MCB2340008.1 magnesium/cobalt transporter CorA [Clostridium estertheticum]MPQ30988.1 magnesium/cobalt transporter CorA [Clostridium estertheticum]MPQ61664.1 magnesium/cobalt transporter CorA [Clostridium estertheticum]